MVSLGALWAFLALYLLRFGLGDSTSAILKILVVSLLPLWLTAAVVTRPFSSTGYRDASVAGAMMLALVLPCLAIYSVAAFLLSFIVLAAFSAFILWKNSRRVLRASLARILASSILFGILLVASGASWRIFLPEQMTLGIANSDSFFHTALAQMIAGYREASIGADGLAFRHYYFLSHAVVAGLSKFSAASVPLVYVYWAAISLKLNLIWAFFLGSWLLENEDADRSSLQLMPRLGFAWLCVIATHALESESFVFALAIFVMLVPLLCRLLRAAEVGTRFRWVALVVALAGAFLCASAKVSVGFLVAVMLGATIWPLRRSPRPLIVLIAALGVLAIVSARYLSPNDALLLNAGWRVFFLSYLSYLDSVALVSFGLPVFMLLLATWKPRFAAERSAGQFDVTASLQLPGSKSRDGLLRRAATWFFVDIPAQMQFLALMLASCIFVFFTMPIGSNVAYFSLVVLISACVIAPALLRSLFGIGFETPAIRKGLAGVLAVVAVVSVAGYVWDTKNSVLLTYRTAFPEIPAEDAKGLLYKSFRQTHSIAGGLAAELPALPWSRLTEDIRQKAALADGKLAVHTRASVEPFWRRLAAGSAWWCIAPHLMIPAELGIPQIRNIAPRVIESECSAAGLVFYGFGKEQDAHRTGALSDAELCRSAKAFDFRKLYLIESITQLERNSVLSCE